MEKQHLEMFSEDINGKFDLVLVEGQESLRREMYDIRDDLSEKIKNNTFILQVCHDYICYYVP